MQQRNEKGQFIKGSIPWIKGKTGFPAHWKGKKMSEVAREKMRNADRTLTSGSNHYNWKGGVTPDWRKMRNSVEHKLWRIAVFERDDYTCQVCFRRGLELHADHIKSFAMYPELRFAIDNGRTLCVGCHKKTDTFAGKIRSTKEYREWLTNRS